jgi:signal peptidase I
MAATLRRLWGNEVFKTVAAISLIPILLASFWFGLPAALNTEMFPVFTVISGSMCIPPEQCSFFADTFERTLHVGDLIIIQGVDAKDLKTDYPNSDIIVFRDPRLSKNDVHANIVHRITDVVEVNGKLYFHTKGDGNGYPNVWPEAPKSVDLWRSNAEDPNSTYEDAISQDYVYGKVVMRIPWVGSLAMLSQRFSFIPIILVILIILLATFEFILPLMKRRKERKQIVAEKPAIIEEPSDSQQM